MHLLTSALISVFIITQEDEVKNAVQLRREVIPISQRCKHISAHKPTNSERRYRPFQAIRHHRANARLYGKRLKARQAKAAA